MDAGQLTLKKAAEIGLASLTVLLIGSFVFYKERLFFEDPSYISFFILNFRSLDIQVHRYGSFITQLVPYIGQQLQLPIKPVLIGYAVSFNLFYLITASLLVYRYKQYRLALLMALYYFIFVSDSYFWISNEIHQAVAWMFLFFGVSIYLGFKGTKVFLFLVPFLLLAFLTLFTHFVVLIPTVYLWVYFILEKKNWPFSNKITIILSCLLTAIIILKFMSAQSYDSMVMTGLTKSSLGDIPGAFTKPEIKKFCTRCLVNYWIAIPVFLSGMVSLFRNNQILPALWTALTLIGYFIVMGLIYVGSIPSYYAESEWQSLGIIIAAPFVFSLLPHLKWSHTAGLITCIFLIRMIYMSTAIPAFSWRVGFEERVMNQMKHKGIYKLALIVDNDTDSRCISNWGASDETLLMSAMNGDKPLRTFFFIRKEDTALISKVTGTIGFYDTYLILPQDKLNRNYFVIDTTKSYVVMDYKELMK